jgi:hypothetical protein
MSDTRIRNKNNNKNENTLLQLYQTNPQMGWIYMILYWCVAIIVSTMQTKTMPKNGMDQHEKQQPFLWLLNSQINNGSNNIWLLAKELTVWHYTAFLVTLVSKAWMHPRYHNDNRVCNSYYIPAIVFAIGNGICETFLFFAFYDFGRYFISDYFNLLSSSGKNYIPIAIGTICFFVYCALVHALFWLILVFPFHVRHTAPPFLTYGLPALTCMSLSWVCIYEYTNDFAFICFLHFLVDLVHGVHIVMPSPFDTTTTTKNSNSTKIAKHIVE